MVISDKKSKNVLVRITNPKVPCLIRDPRLRVEVAKSYGRAAYSGALFIFLKDFSGELVKENGVPKI